MVSGIGPLSPSQMMKDKTGTSLSLYEREPQTGISKKNDDIIIMDSKTNYGTEACLSSSFLCQHFYRESSSLDIYR